MSPDRTSRPVHVVAAAVTDGEGRVLIAERPPGKALAGSWEFPGGKLEAGEGRIQGLARELHEELGITLTGPPRPLMRVQHRYPFGDVLIDMWVVTHYGGEPRGLDGQRLRWCIQDELGTAELLPADRPIVRALRLPAQLTEASTPRYSVSAWHSMWSVPDPDPVNAAGQIRLRGVFCGSVPEAIAAGAAGADFLVLSEALSPEELAALCQSTPVPVYARGLRLEEAWVLGASGLWQATDL